MNNVYHDAFYAMGTRCHIVCPDLDPEIAEGLFRILKEEIQRIESMISYFLPKSEISLINRTAYCNPVSVSQEVYTLLKTCQQYSEATKGAFDITMRPLLKYWVQTSSHQNHDEHVKQCLEKTGMRHLQFDDEQQTIQFSNSDTEIDLGGVGKGYALERINTLLDNFSVVNAFVSFGESSILTRGCHPGGDCWRIGINDYLNPGHSVHTFFIRNGSMSNSSNFFMDDSGTLNNHRHVINPFTGWPIEEIHITSVSTPSALFAEILSTALLVLPEEKICILKEELEPMHAIKVNYESGKAEVRVF